ncbi:MAG: hypothetical protein ACJATT_005503 [Myxococcota bacterium]
MSEADHLLYSAVCDANCCVGAGRLLTFDYRVGLELEPAAAFQTRAAVPFATTSSWPLQ